MRGLDIFPARAATPGSGGGSMTGTGEAGGIERKFDRIIELPERQDGLLSAGSYSGATLLEQRDREFLAALRANSGEVWTSDLVEIMGWHETHGWRANEFARELAHGLDGAGPVRTWRNGRYRMLEPVEPTSQPR